jgi:hypothetical protein
MILGEYRGSRGRVCVASVGNQPWLDCAVTICWRGCLPLVISTCLSEFLCILFRHVIVPSNHTYRSFPVGARQVDDHIFEWSEGVVQVKKINDNDNDKEFGSQGGNDAVDENFCCGQTCGSS